MRHSARIAVVIPALDEEASILPDWVDDIVVVDNGSRDATAARAKASGARVIRERTRGYGSACQAGIRQVSGVEVVVFLDADNSDSPQEMDRLVDPIVLGSADLVVGSRVLGDPRPGSLSVLQRNGNRLACILMRWIWGAEYTDLGPFRAIDYRRLVELAIGDTDFGWTIEMQIEAKRRGLRVMEVPVSYRQRLEGASKISGSWRGSLGASVKILKVIAGAALPSAFPGSDRR